MQRIKVAVIGPTRRPGHAAHCLLAPSRRVVAAVSGLTLAMGGIVGCGALAGGQPVRRASDQQVTQVVARNPLTVSSPGAARRSDAVALAVSAGVDDGWFFDHPHTQSVNAPAASAGTAALTTPSRLGALGGTSGTDASAASSLAGSGIPSTALAAYRAAAAREALRRPSCGLVWPLLAGIGRVESNHGRFAGAVLHTDGVSTPRIVGIPLTGNGTERITDTDRGQLDGDPVFDRAVGPMQFIPSTWASWGVDANHDGRKDPFNIYDAAAAAANYLCAAGRNLRTYAGQVQAVRSYNNSDSYIAMVLQLERLYADGVGNIRVPVVPTSPGTPRVSPTHAPTLPPVDPGTPAGLPLPRPRPRPSPSVSPSTSRSSTPSGTASSSPTPAPSTSLTAPSPTQTSATNTSPAPGVSTTPTGSPTSSGGPTTGVPSTTDSSTVGVPDVGPGPAASWTWVGY